MDNKENRKIKTRIINIIDEILNRSNIEDFITSPVIPDVLDQPDFLVVPDRGSLLAINICNVPQGNITNKSFWNFTLETIESLFEIKVAAGPETVVGLLLFNWGITPRQNDAIKLLETLYDYVNIVDTSNPELEYEIENFVNNILPIGPKLDLDYFWGQESSARRTNLNQFEDLPYVNRLFMENEQTDFGRPPRSNDLHQLKQEAFQQIESTEHINVIRNPRVFNMKQLFLDTFVDYYFTFDFLAGSQIRDYESWHILNGEDLDDIFSTDGVLLNVIRGNPGTYNNINLIKRLATYARFISYQARDERLILRQIKPKLYLLIDGDVLGPRYDPVRYLRLLIASGWVPVRSEQPLNDIFPNLGEPDA